MEEKFVKFGFYPLEPIKNKSTPVKCKDSEGYLYSFSYNNVQDKRSLLFKRFMKANPYKIYNMRRYVELEQPGSTILSTDEEIMREVKLTFLCPICLQPFIKKWCHWLQIEKGKHTCCKCSRKRRSTAQEYEYKDLIKIYQSKGLKLLSSYNEYINGERSHQRLNCQDSEGYKYSVNVTNLQQEFSGKNKYSKKNPFALDNIILYCKLNDIESQVLNFEDRKSSSLIVRCFCGKEYITSLDKFMSGQTRCRDCSKVKSGLERKIGNWLNDNRISYIEQYIFQDCKRIKPLRFDFYIEREGKRYCIETDGLQHRKPIKYFGGEQAFALQQEKDYIKAQYCLNNNIVLIRLTDNQINKGEYRKILSKFFFES